MFWLVSSVLILCTGGCRWGFVIWRDRSGRNGCCGTIWHSFLREAPKSLDKTITIRQSFPREVVSKVTGQNDNHMTVNMLKADAGSDREGKHDIASPIESNSFGKVDPQCVKSPGPYCYSNTEYSITADQNEGKCMEASYYLPIGKIGPDIYTEKTITDREGKHEIASPIENNNFGKIDTQCGKSPGPYCYVNTEYCITAENEGKCLEASYSLPTGTIGLDVYTGKTITEIDPTETITCFTKDASHSVKEICIDEGVHNLEKVLVESDEDRKLSSRSVHYVSNGNHSLAKGITDNTEELTDDTEPNSQNEHPASLIDKDGSEQCSSGSSLIGGDKSGSVSPSEMIRDEQSLPLQEFDANPWKVDSPRFNYIKDQKQDVHQETDQRTLREGNLATKAPSVDVEANQSNETKESPANGEMGVIKLHFDSRVATVSGSEESEENVNQQSGLGQYIPKPEETTLDSTTPARSSFGHYGHADNSLVHHGHVDLNGPTLFGSTVSSGHISYSGNISLRSESSTTSARSFAFPMLQAEWNSSPIKMPKADRRHRGWRMGLLCCRF